MFEVRIPKTGDSAEADTFALALYAAGQLLDEYAAASGVMGARRAAQASVVITEDGTYAGIATALAREGVRS